VPKKKPTRPRADLTGAARRLAVCMICGETNEIAAHGTCYKCYRRMQREKETQQADRRFDRHSTKRAKEQDKLIAGLGIVMKGLTMIGVPDALRLSIRAQLEPYLQTAKPILGGPPSPFLDVEGISAHGAADDDTDEDEDESEQ
jgi:hypothetical protein